MAKPPVQPERPPEDYAQVPPRDLHPMADIRFVIGELSKLNTQVARLIHDVDGIDTKMDTVRHQITFVKGAMWVIGGVLAVVVVVLGWYFSGKLSVTVVPGA